MTKDGNTNLIKNIDFPRYRIGVPMTRVETPGAGGGSIGRIDEIGLSVSLLKILSTEGISDFLSQGLESGIEVRVGLFR